MKRFILVALVLCVLVGVASAWGASMGEWDYRKEITVNNTGAELTDYQVMFNVNRSAGSDSGFTVYLDGKCESDYDDIRFTTGENTLCDYWIESSSSTVATIWVEVPTIASGDTTLYLYYGNSGAAAVSDGDATFPFFDNFSGESLDDTKWTVVSGSVSLSNSIMTFNNAGVYTKNIAGKYWTSPNILRAKYNCTYIGETGSYSNAIYLNPYTYTNNYWAAFIAWGAGTGGKFCQGNAVGLTTSAITGYTANNWAIWEMKDTGTKTIWSVNGENIKDMGSTYYSNPGNYVLKMYGYPAYIDWILWRKYAATEPTISAWGSEEAQSPKYLTVDFSGVPTSGYVPLTVYFTDATVGYNVTLDTWTWSFGDSSANSTQQDPAHTYTTSGLYNLILTVTNTSFSKTNTTQKTAYINVTVNPDAPSADFTVTETCGDVGDTFYFIDFSTGGGLYAWNWSFGDGAYSELRNPTHQYSSNGTYDVGLTVWGAYGNDTLTRSNLITIPCGAATPTPTVTPTVTGTPVFTEGNATFIYAPDQDYVPFPIWLAIVIVTIALFGHSIIFLKNSDLTAIMAALFAMVSAWLSNMIGYIDVQVTSYAEEIVISPVIQAVHPPWLVYTMLIFAFVSVVNIFAAIYKVYLKPVPYNEIYDRKLPKWERRK
jgi:PKD repeat protein